MRVSGFVMTDESGDVLAVSVGGSGDLLKAASCGSDMTKAAPESAEELVAEHEHLVDVLRSPDHKDDLEEAAKQEAELAEYRAEAGEEMSKAHVKGYTRKDGTYVEEHDDSRQAAQAQQPSARPVPAQKVNAISDKHSEALISKSPEWDHNGFRGKKVPASDVAGLPEFSHKEVYGHDSKTSPAGTDFSKEFAGKGHQGFVLKHPDGKRSFVDTQGYNYARYHAPVDDAPAADAPAQASSSPGKFEYPSHVKNWSDKAHFLEQIPESQRTPEWKAAYKKASVQSMYGKGQSPEYKAHLAASKGGASKGGDAYGHPNVVGKADFGEESPEKGWSMKFAGTEYTATGKEGNSMHDQTPVREFESEDGHRVWADAAGRVHADSTSEVAALRQKHEASAKPAAKASAKVASKKEAAVTDASLKKHPMWSQSDFDYFKEKGYEPKEIKEIWDRDQASGHSPVTHQKAPDVVGVVSDPDHNKKGAAKKVVAKTQNEGYGYHGEAMNQHIRDKHGEEAYLGSLSEKDVKAAYDAGHKKFAEAAQKLVDAGHFDNHDQAREYLDSTHGRHLHDGATFHGGDISKVKWLAKDVAAYKKKAGLAGKPMAKALLFVGSKSAAAELAEMAKSHVSAYTRKDGVFVADHERQVVAHLPKNVKQMVRDVATSDAAPEHKKAAIDALVAPHVREAGFGFDEGAGVKVTGRVGGQGQVGVIHSVAPSGHFYIVKFPDGTRASYHESDLTLHDGDDLDDDDWENDR